MSKLKQGLLGAALWMSLLASNSQAIGLGFSPVAQNVVAGAPADVAITISGLGDGTAPSLSTFDLDIDFDPAVLSFRNVSFADPVRGDQLDVHGVGGNPTSYGVVAPGVLNLFELSLDSPGDLDLLQAGDFTLATLTFDSLGGGTSVLAITIRALGDANGASLVASVANGGITYTVVAEPSMLPLLGAGLVALAWMGRRDRATGVGDRSSKRLPQAPTWGRGRPECPSVASVSAR